VATFLSKGFEEFFGGALSSRLRGLLRLVGLNMDASLPPHTHVCQR
jgi:hypothetical protein